MPQIISAIIVSYLIGSIPTAYLFGRALKGIDIRKFGSGNVGATNALRVLGKKAGLAVLALDILKGLGAVVIVGDILIAGVVPFSAETLRIILGFSCICGHNWTVFLKFRGGKGVATTLGVLLGLSLKISGLKLILGAAILTWLAVMAATRIVSLASVLTSLSFPLYMLIFKKSRFLVLMSIALSAFIILRHKANLKRICQGKEPRLNFKPPH